MIRCLILGIAALTALTACAPYEALPTSPGQWERRQTEIEYREAERVRLCAIMDKDSDRFKRDCTRPGDPK